ncbi:TPA: murein biosynthesis integral membrane protein MurJ [Patescibacteria group bacterium]|nr:murein biosynthesis integral membrane protein MurJ [Patescibacteria group bacterium]
MAASIINLSLIVTLILLLPLVIFTRQISYLLVPGFNETERELMISFTRIMLVGQLVPLMVGNFVTGMLQSYQRFILPSLAPIAYNIGIIIGVLLFAQSLGLYAAVWGVVIGAILYLLIQLPLIIHLGYRHEWKLELDNRGVREVMHLMMPRTFGLAISQIDTTVDLILASYLGSRSITIFYFAQHLQQLPIGLFGATFAQAALPTLSLEGAKKDLESFKKFLLASMHQILFLVLPASVILIVLRIPVVRLVFGAARFDWPATVYTGMTLSFFAISIFAQSLVQLFARGFYALYDTRTPVIVGVLSVIINTSASIVLVSVLHLPVWALAISTSAASIVNAALLLILLYRKVNGFDLHLLLVPPLKMVVASLITGIFLYVPIKLLDRLGFDTTQVVNLLLLTGIAAFSGLSVYVFLAWFFDIEEVGTFFKLLQKVKRAPRVFFNATEELVSSDHPSIS